MLCVQPTGGEDGSNREYAETKRGRSSRAQRPTPRASLVRAYSTSVTKLCTCTCKYVLHCTCRCVTHILADNNLIGKHFYCYPIVEYCTCIMMQFHMHTTQLLDSIMVTLTSMYIVHVHTILYRSKHRSKGERQLRRLRANHVKCLRQLSGKAGKVASKKHGRNIIQSYTNFGSEVRLHSIQ